MTLVGVSIFNGMYRAYGYAAKMGVAERLHEGDVEVFQFLTVFEQAGAEQNLMNSTGQIDIRTLREYTATVRTKMQSRSPLELDVISRTRSTIYQILLMDGMFRFPPPAAVPTWHQN